MKLYFIVEAQTGSPRPISVGLGGSHAAYASRELAEEEAAAQGAYLKLVFRVDEVFIPKPSTNSSA